MHGNELLQGHLMRRHRDRLVEEGEARRRAHEARAPRFAGLYVLAGRIGTACIAIGIRLQALGRAAPRPA